MNKGRKFLCVIIFLLALCGIVEAKTSKASNISKLFTSVNPSLNAKTATNYAKVIIKACEKYKQDPYAIAALIVHESTVNNKAISKGGDYGLMQIRWSVHEKAIKKKFPKVKKASDILNAKINIYYGTELFADCVKKGGSTRGGVLRYSAGNEKLADKVMNTMKELQSMDNTSKVKAKKK